MSELSDARCSACRADAPPASDEDKVELMTHIPAWELVERDGIERLQRVFAFDDFAAALAFTLRVGAIAEEQGHHPAITTEWGKVTVSWWTHAIGGLHRNDFIMAARTDELASSS